MLMFILFLIGVLGLYGLYLIVTAENPGAWRQAFDWLNPYNIKKGFVLGSVLRHEAWKERDKAQSDLDALVAEAANRKADAERVTLNEGIQKLYESVNEPVPTPPVKTFFGGSTSTTKRQRIEPLNDDFDGVIGTIEGGVSATPEEYLRKFSGRHAGAFIRRKK